MPVKEDFTVPAGTKVSFNGHWAVQDLSFLDADTPVHREADLYGITIEEVDVTDIRDVKAAKKPRKPAAPT